MVYIAISLYCMLFSFGCYYFIKQQCEREIFELREEYDDHLLKLRKAITKISDQHSTDNKRLINDHYSEFESELNKRLDEVQKDIFTQSQSYLSKIDKNISSVMEEIKQDVKKKRVI